jgi:signal transduction histidine kinase
VLVETDEDQVRIFKPFERGESAFEAFVPGFGLGLALVKDLATAIGAGVELRSTMGRGTTFTVVLPLRERPGARDGVVLALEAGRTPR